MPPSLRQRLPQIALAVTLALLVVHVIAARRLELMFDEAYYALWSRHLQWGYHDHPPAIAAWIGLSTELFGPSEWGVRAMGVLASAVGAYALYTIADDLFGDQAKAALAALIWNAAPLVGIGSILATPDVPLVTGWVVALWALVRVWRTSLWQWWLVVGFGAGIALEAKYTALFLGPGILLAMTWVPDLRRWLRHPSPYLGGLVALAMFLPNVFWNASHGWQSFAKQFSRVGETEWTLTFLGEFLGGQLALLGPLTFVLVVAGFVVAARWRDTAGIDQRRLLTALAAPLLAFFVLHSLHDRVQPNWMAPIYPILALLAADVTLLPAGVSPWGGRLLQTARDWSVPTGLAITALVYAHALVAPLPQLLRSDPTHLLMGWRALARDVAVIADREQARYVLTQGYALASLLKYYGTSGPPVFQFNERQRWSFDTSEGVPDAGAPGLYVTETRHGGSASVAARFSDVALLGNLDRMAGGATLERYEIYRVSNPRRPILDHPEDSRR